MSASGGGTALYIDPWMGVAGDMLMAALLDTDRGGDVLEPVLRSALAAMSLDPQIVSIRSEVDHGIVCTAVSVLPEANAPLRHLEDLLRIVGESSLAEQIKERARHAFTRLAEVEASVHGCPVDDIHFHEVGAVDTLVDVVGVLSLVDALGIETVGVGTIPVGGGSIDIAHGRLGVPAPATAALLLGYEIAGGPEMAELTTPTGALLVSELGARSGALPPMVVERVGCGCGSARFSTRPNVLRVLVGQVPGEQSRGAQEECHAVVELQTNLDNIPAEVVGYVCGLLRTAVAFEVCTSPAFMNKDRPGSVLHVLAAPDDAKDLGEIILRETGTLGVRWAQKARLVAERGVITARVAGAEVRVKWGRFGGRVISVAPEFDSAVEAARSLGLPLKDVMAAAAQRARESLGLEGEVTQ
jgi:uncharacterized protein (TIGR00299 family) protein